MKVRIKQIIDKFGSLRYAVQYRKLLIWKTFDDYGYFNSAIIAANKLQTWNKTWYDWQNLGEKEEEKRK